MSDKKYAKLVMVTPDNNNKYYEMTYNGGSNFDVKYGRIESTAQTATYPISKWSSKYNEKVNKGYKDITHTVSVTVQTTDKKSDASYVKISDAKVDTFLNLMKQYTDGLVAKTYTVKATNVTQAQVDEAQKYIDELMKIGKTNTTAINNKLIELYMIIPRYMGNVRDYLLPRINIDKVLQQEQDNLDAMAAQVAQFIKSTKKTKKTEKKTNTLLDVLGISMSEIKGHPDLKYLTDQLNTNKIQGIFEISKPEHDMEFNDWMKKQKNTQTRVLLHGTRCTSVIPIIEQGLKIRPVGNYQFSGKIYGDGNYFSETCSKSLNYTGYDNDQVLLVFEVHTGNPFVYNGWYNGNSFPLTYPELQKRGFDSTFVKAGNGLLNSEIIAYKEPQCHIKYIIWYKR